MISTLAQYGIKIHDLIIREVSGKYNCTLVLHGDKFELEKVTQLLRVFRAEDLKILKLTISENYLRVVTLTIKDLHDLVVALRELGNGALAILYYMGYRAGKLMADRISGMFSKDSESLQYFVNYLESLGLGQFEITDYESGKICKIIIKNSVECSHIKSESPYSQIIRGLLSGFITSLWNVEVKAMEVSCAAKGDPYCEFHISPMKRKFIKL